MVVAYNMGEWREIPRAAQADQGRHRRLARHLRAHGVRRPHGRGRGGHDPRGAAVHPHASPPRRRSSQVTDDYVEDGRVAHPAGQGHPDYVTIFRIHGPFLFGATDKLHVVTENIDELPPVVILRLRNMTAIDATGLLAIEEIAKQLHASQRTLILCGAREQPAQLIHQAEFEEIVGPENICENVQDALRRAEEVYEHLEAQHVAVRN